MTQPHLLEQAKQGDPQAIAALMNKSLQPKGMTAYVDRQGNHLEVVLKSDRIPNRQALTTFVEQGIHNLGIETIQTVTVSGQQLGALSSAWTETLYLDPLVPGFEPDPALAMTGSSAELDSGLDFGLGSELDAGLDTDATASFSASEPSDLSQLQDLLSDQSEQSLAEPQRQELESRLEGLWAEQSADQHRDFLSELMAEEPQDATHQFEAFLAEQPDDRFQSQEQEGLWNALAEPEPKTDDFLADLNLEDSRQALTHQLQGTPNDWQAAEEDEDEPDEILLNFLEEQPQVPADFGLDEMGEPIDEPDEVLPDFLETFSESSANNSRSEFAADTLEQPIDFLNGSPEEEAPDLGFSTTANTESSDAELLDLLAAEPEPDPLLELTDDQPAAWNDESFGQTGEFSLNSSPDPIDELSLGVEAEPVSPQIDFSAGEFEATTDTNSQSWEPPIEFLQSDLEPPAFEAPTEQFDRPLADFATEPSDPARPADFPPDFLQESPADQSHDLFVEPQTNPFLEQMEDQDRERSQKPDEKPSETLNQFDQSEWLLEDTDPDSQPQGLNDQFLEDTDPLSDQSLINFFEEDTDPGNTGSQFGSQLSDDTSQFADSGEFADYRVTPDNPDVPLYSLDDSEPDQPISPYGNLSDRSDQEEYLDLSLEPDQPESSSYYAETTVPPQYPTTEVPDPANSDSTYIQSQAGETQIPAYQEPSPEDLEQQVAELYPEDNYVARNASSEVVEVPSESRGSPWLFPLILLGISGWIVGLISFAFLWSRLSSPPPETASTSPADVVASPNAAPTACPSTTNAVGNAPIALSELQFQQNQSNPQQINLTGCLTNRTQQPVDIVSLGYRSGNANSSTVGGLNFSNSVIQPGQTVPFTSKFTLPSDTTDLAINTVYWQPAGQTTSKEANASVKLNR